MVFLGTIGTRNPPLTHSMGPAGWTFFKQVDDLKARNHRGVLTLSITIYTSLIFRDSTHITHHHASSQHDLYRHAHARSSHCRHDEQVVEARKQDAVILG
jgi:hypothetical protein